MLSGKVWGTTRLIESNPSLEAHWLDIRAGGFCSKHRHNHKFNGFLLISGKLKIRVWKNDYDLTDETELNPGDYTVIKPGEFHQFHCIEDAVCLELYWTAFDPNDIERETVGGQNHQDQA